MFPYSELDSSDDSPLQLQVARAQGQGNSSVGSTVEPLQIQGLSDSIL